MSERYENWKELKPLTAPASVGTRCVCLARYGSFAIGDQVIVLQTSSNCLFHFCHNKKVRQNMEFPICELALLPSEEPAKVERKIVQIATDEIGIAALCNDGTLWFMVGNSEQWEKFPPIPQDAV